jgi:hypothetical protein
MAARRSVEANPRVSVKGEMLGVGASGKISAVTGTPGPTIDRWRIGKRATIEEFFFQNMS